MAGPRRRVEITNPLGLHLRAANRLSQLAQQFDAQVCVHWNGRQADAKSILDLLTLGAEAGTFIEFEASGADSEEAAEALVNLVAQRFHEQADEPCENRSPSLPPSGLPKSPRCAADS